MRESKRTAMNFRLAADVLAALRKRAKKDGVSMTTVVEAVLRNALGVPSYGQRITDWGAGSVRITKKGGAR